jgi:Protein of unknown function (DUF4038)/Putative collagen-binding domain of a collagenase
LTSAPIWYRPHMPQNRFPLRVAAEGAYFLDAGGKPFPFHGWCAGNLLTDSDLAEAASFLDDRVADGVTALAVDLVSAAPEAWHPNRAGQQPFEHGIDRPVRDYFEAAARFLRLAHDRDLAVFLHALPLASRGHLDPTRTSDPRTCIEPLLHAGEAGASSYGRFLADVFGTADNVIWVLGGSDTESDTVPLLRAIAEQLTDLIPGVLIAAQGRPDDRFFEMFEDEAWPSLHAITSYEVPHQVLREELARRPGLPAVLIDSTYENELGATPQMIRRQIYWAMTSGACGQFVGSTLLTPRSAVREDRVTSSAAARDLSRARSFMERIPWWTLKATNYTADIVAGGIGQLWGVNTCTAASTAKRDVAVVYVPTGRPIDVDFSKLAMGRYVARTFQPDTGAVGPPRAFRSAGAWTIEPPGNGDWALVIATDDLLGSLAEADGMNDE